eukprot:gnl/MRDRNA2_/MRDRNA2_164989_c0_seq1.p1 gnl/MRDRNA2_/MRDRNA2_164989_c0~~gnl/MRDRNA2_/MRDRNA2_164989_c0_seq1.p1  ORF type:complete len:149 (-),score=11.43 gnl/MRDRNA2_/MRDRNA2_164989_c0_seq1:49-495(-)
MVNWSLDNTMSFVMIDYDSYENKLGDFICFRGFSDGGVRGQSDWNATGVGACGWVLQGGTFDENIKVSWSTIAYGGVFLGHSVTSFDAELSGVEGLAFTLLYMFGLSEECCALSLLRPPGLLATRGSPTSRNQKLELGRLHVFVRIFP